MLAAAGKMNRMLVTCWRGSQVPVSGGRLAAERGPVASGGRRSRAGVPGYFYQRMHHTLQGSSIFKSIVIVMMYTVHCTREIP